MKVNKKCLLNPTKLLFGINSVEFTKSIQDVKKVNERQINHLTAAPMSKNKDAQCFENFQNKNHQTK